MKNEITEDDVLAFAARCTEKLHGIFKKELQSFAAKKGTSVKTLTWPPVPPKLMNLFLCGGGVVFMAEHLASVYEGIDKSQSKVAPQEFIEMQLKAMLNIFYDNIKGDKDEKNKIILN